MKKLVLALAILTSCSVSFAGGRTLKKPTLNKPPQRRRLARCVAFFASTTSPPAPTTPI
jgi:membrane protein DedA with SNARE-associated domain